MILGDEPVANLDPVTATGVLELLVQLSRSGGVTLILSLHDVQLARAYCTRAIGLVKGRVVYDEPVSRLTSANLALIYDESVRSALQPAPSTASSATCTTAVRACGKGTAAHQ